MWIAFGLETSLGADADSAMRNNWGPVKHVVNECTSAKIVAARKDAIKELDSVGVTSKDHLFNVLFRRVGVKEFLWRKVAHIGAQFLIKSDILGNF